MSLRKMLFAVTLLVVGGICTGAAVAQSGTDAKTTRYWDSCTPHCGWNANAGGNPVVQCNATGGVHSGETSSSCGGGSGYTCPFQAPFTIDDVGYGFVAINRNEPCGTCYELTFKSRTSHGTNVPSALVGKKMIVMKTNIGDMGAADHFDILIPGGGVGQFNGLTRQLQANGVSNPQLGAERGGFGNTCNFRGDCIKQMCDAAFGAAALSSMKSGCYWYVDWYQAADNPNVDWRVTTCPEVLTSRYKGTNTTYGGSGTTQPTTYTITFNPNSGTVTPTTATTGTNGRLTSLPTPTRSGYTFNGWFTAATGGTSVTTSTTFTANTIIYAQWTAAASTYTITFNPNSGTVSPTTATTGTNGRLTSLPTPTRSGYTFAGWFTAATGGTSVTTNTTFTANTTIYAQWTASSTQNYTITFNVNYSGGSISPPTATTVNGRLESLPNPVRDGYTFTGWYLSASGGTQVTTGTSFTQNTTVYAQWTSGATPGYTITFNVNYTGGSISPSTATTVNGRLESLPTPVRSGYTFSGWYNSTTGGTQVTPSTVFSQNATIYARWTSGGGGDRNDTTKVEAESLTSPSLPNCNPNQDNPMCIGTNGGITNIGYISEGNTATYNVSGMRAGAYTLAFRIGHNWDQGASGFTVTVNGSNAGTITHPGTGDWDTYVTVTLGSDVTLNQGSNTIVLNFNGPINVDYFLLIGEAEVSVRFDAVRSSRPVPRASVALRSVSGGFIAGLPANHVYTSYRLIDLQGREILRGNIAAGTTDLRFGNLKSGVVFLRLEGAGVKPVALRATAAR